MKKIIFSLAFAGMATLGFGQCEPVSSINENFDSWEEIDECWSTVTNGGMIYADSNVTFYGFMGGGISMYLISPEIVAGDYALTFDASTLSLGGEQAEGVTLEVGTVTTAGDTSSFTSVSETYTLLNDGQSIQVPVSFTEENKYFAVKISVTAPHSAAGIDNLVLAAETAGVKDLNDVKAQVYPNPVTDQMNISAEESIREVKIYNMAGQLAVSARPNNQTTVVNMASLKPGVYIAQIVTARGTQTTKVIKK